jgi:two-component system nitrogen regulation sensor histidine kinase NtrY
VSAVAENRQEATSTRIETERRRRRREGFLIIACGLAVLAFVIWEIRKPNAQVGAAGNVFSFLLVNLNIILLLLLVFLVLRNVVKLVIERRRQVPGSQLRSRMVMAFVVIALFPAVVMLLVSVEFMTNTIDNWFSTEVESSLRGAWRLAQTHYRHTADEAVSHASALSRDLAAEGLENLARKGRVGDVVGRYQQAYKLGTVQVFGRDGRQMLALFSRDTPTGIPLGSDRDLLAATAGGETATRVERYGESDIIRGAAPVRSRDGSRLVGTVIVDVLVERSARVWSEEILDAFREYRHLKLNKRPFKTLYVMTLALASLVVVFSATWLGLYLARGITEPLTQLAAATRRIAEGDWEVELPDSGGDEIGSLVRAFDSMTVQLRTSHEELAERGRYIENILRQIDAGVVSVDQHGKVSTVNPAAISLLGLRAVHLVGVDARELFTGAGYPQVVVLLDDIRSGAVPSGTGRNVTREEEGRTLQVSATTLEHHDGSSAGVVLFFENVSQMLEVQRMEAWREVARRIAHEIKNPLTPIQLSAQRLRRRLRTRLDGEEGELFDDCTNTIVHEVEALKNLVNEFSRFARRPTGDMRVCDLNQLVEETMPLYRQSRPDLRIDFEAGAGLPLVLMNREAVKRALVNLLDNAVSAVASTRELADVVDSAPADSARAADITVRTHLDADLSRVVLEVSDRGPGIPPEHRARVFEPYFSTKADGTGLGLAVVASIAADHRAYLRLHDNEPHGSRFVIEFPPAEAA